MGLGKPTSLGALPATYAGREVQPVTRRPDICMFVHGDHAWDAILVCVFCFHAYPDLP